MTTDQTGPTTAASHRADDDFLTDDQIRAALDTGDATPLSRLIIDHVHYRDHWWCAFGGGWFRITDQELITYLDNRRARTADGHYLGGPVDGPHDR